MSPSPGPPRGGATGDSIEEYQRVLMVISMALIGSVAVMVGGAWALVASGTFQPFLSLQLPVRIGVGVFLLVLLAATYPLSRAVGSGGRPESREEALSIVQTRVMVGMAVRDAVGAMSAVLILLAGDVTLGGTVGALTLVSMVTSLPRLEQLEEATRGLPAEA